MSAALRRRLPWAASLAVWLAMALCGNQSWFNGWWLVGSLALGWVSWFWIMRANRGLEPAEMFVWFVLINLPGLCSSPILEDDPYRFLWDGRQFALTGNPYRDAPAAHFADAGTPEPFQRILDQINYPDVPTIYGPVSELGFLVGHLVSPGHLWPWKVILLVAQWAMWRGLGRLMERFHGPNPLLTTHEPTPSIRNSVFPIPLFMGRARAWKYAVCPLAVFESSFNAHPDGLGVALMVAALCASDRKHWLVAAVWGGLAAAARITAIVILPFVLLRGGWRSWLTAVLTLILCYLPFWMQGSLADLEGLRAFVTHWEFNSSVFGLLRWIVGSETARRMTAAGLGGILLLLLWRQVRVKSGGMPRGDLVFGSCFLLSATVNPWYLLWLLPFVAIRPTAWGVTAMVAVGLSYLYSANLGDPAGGFEHPLWVRGLEYGLIAVAAGWGRI